MIDFDLEDLPDGWLNTNIGEIATILDSQRIPLNSKQREQRKGIYPYYGANGKVDSIDEFIFDGEYILLAEDGGFFDNPLKDVAYSVDGKFWVNNHAHILGCLGGMPTKFLVHGLNSINWMPHVSGSTRLKLTQGSLRKVPIPIPPLNEQRRIVTKIEALTAHSSRARAALDDIPTLIDQFRQSVLAAAFRGDLTADWRKQNPDVEPAENLLERIRAERRRKWEKACTIAQKEGKRNPKVPKENNEQIEADELPNIPHNWHWNRLVNLAELLGGVTKGRNFKGRTTIQAHYLRVANVQDGFLDLEEIKKIEVLPEDIDKYHLETGDILFTEGGDRDKLGRGTVWQNEVAGCIHQNHVYRARLYGSEILPAYISLAAKTEYSKDYFFKNASQTVNLASINMTTLGKLPIPIPPYEEQKLICHRVQQAFKTFDQLRRTHESSIEEVNLLDQSIIAKAFRGELVPQDPNDEPASVLLDRIRAEREKLSPKPQKSRTTRKKPQPD